MAAIRSPSASGVVAKALLGLALALLALQRDAAAQEGCAQLVSAQGQVEIRRAGQETWERVAGMEASRVCAGDRLRTGSQSRAALLLAPHALVRVAENTALGVTLSPKETLVEFDSGAVYSISRFPRRYRILTPFVNAGVEGTEFLVTLAPAHAEIAVYEGRVVAQDGAGAQRALAGGEVGRFAQGTAPQVRALVAPADAVQWALYYPPLSAQPSSAERRLRLGQVEAAEREADDALAAIIRVVKNDRAGALERAQRALGASPASARAWLALSYARQASFELEAALEAAQRAAALEPGSAVAQARRAELLLSAGRVEEARAAASAAVQADPTESRAHTVLGFAELARLDAAAARPALVRAAALDPSDPLPRLGLGLAAIKQGRLEEGRAELEIAVALDPQNALLRSYLGKAYHEEERDALAGTQLERAKRLDPLDPTPWYYDAIRLQALNRPAEALGELHESMARNDNRAVYRSRLLLDQDQAARAASLAHIHSDLGFDELALSEALRALGTDPRNFAAHRFLAEAYQALPRYEIARVSELLQSQLLQPAASAVLAPRLGEVRIPIPHGAGPRTPSFHELNPLFTRDGHLFSLGGVLGGQGTAGDEALYAWRGGTRTVQLGQFYFDTEGHRPNADLRQRSNSLLYQDDFSVASSWQLEGRTTRIDSGDVRLQFDPTLFSPNERRRIDTDALRLGWRHSPSPRSTWLASFIATERSEDLRAQLRFPGVTVDSDDAARVRSTSGELQYLGSARGYDLVAGGGLVRERDRFASVSVVTLEPGPPFPPDEFSVRSRARHGNAYAYGLLRAPGGGRVTLGLALDDFHDEVRFSQRRYSPKLGAVLPLGAGTTLRAAAFRSVKRPLAANQTLEPTQVAGFNQLFDDVNQTRAERVGAAIDQRFSRNLFAGLELTGRALEVPILGADERLAGFQDWRERLHRAYASWVIGPRWSAGLEYVYEHRGRELPPGTGDVFPARITSHHVPVSVAWHHPGGAFASLRLTYVEQRLRFVDPFGTPSEGDTDFGVADLSLGMRLPRRLGSVSLDILNLFDERFRYQDTDFLGTPRLPLYQPRRLALLRVRINL